MSENPAADSTTADLPDGFSDAPAQEHDEISADEDARDEQVKDDQDGAGTSGLLPLPADTVMPAGTEPDA